MRKRSLALACASVVAGVMLGPLPAAHAAVAPQLSWVGFADSPASGVMALSAHSDSAVTSITAHLYAPGSGAGDPEVAEVGDFTLKSGTAQSGVWNSGAPLRLADLGTYRVVVDLTDADGDTTTAQGTYGYEYELEANLTDLRATPQNPDYEHQDVTVTGGFTVTDPRTGKTTPAANERVDLEISSDPDAATRTGADGRFTYTYHVDNPSSDSVNAWLRPDEPWYQSRANESVEVRAVQSDTRVTLDAAELDVKAGQAAKVSGTAEVYVGGAWKPLAGATVDEIWSDEFGGVASRPVTGADGRFSGQLTLPKSGTVEVQVRAGTFMRTGELRTVKVYVAEKTSITNFTASLDKYAQLTAKGLLNTGRSIPAGVDNKVDLQYSADGKTGWKTMKTVTPGSFEPNVGATFKGTFTTSYKGYYRAHFKAARSFQESYSSVVHATRTPTRITDGNAAPEPVRKGRTITYKGKLQHYTSGVWKAYAGQAVKILFKPKGSSSWYDMGNATTRTDGTFSRGFTASKDGTWVAVLLYPNSTHLVSSGREDYVDVT
ncbi:hypothetical protein OG780_20805 [Streptomyces sp. NBC_00386]|uniref:hypothetical protein n=1 Tax=Streptomyces sp. NBC_00386 TaxID=2975734 RepID=UPI002E233D91